MKVAPLGLTVIMDDAREGMETIPASAAMGELLGRPSLEDPLTSSAGSVLASSNKGSVLASSNKGSEMVGVMRTPRSERFMTTGGAVGKGEGGLTDRGVVTQDRRASQVHEGEDTRASQVHELIDAAVQQGYFLM